MSADRLRKRLLTISKVETSMQALLLSQSSKFHATSAFSVEGSVYVSKHDCSEHSGDDTSNESGESEDGGRGSLELELLTNVVLLASGSVEGEDDTHLGLVTGVVSEAVISIDVLVLLQLAEHVHVNLVGGFVGNVRELVSPASVGTIVELASLLNHEAWGSRAKVKLLWGGGSNRGDSVEVSKSQRLRSNGTDVGLGSHLGGISLNVSASVSRGA